MFPVILAIILLLLITYAIAGHSAAPWVPCRADDVARIIKIADIKPGQKIYELGCGDGRILFAAAQLGAHAAGCEISLIPFAIAHLRRIFTRGPKPTIEYKNLWNVSLADQDLVIIFLMPRIMEKLRAKLERELKPGARVICYVFTLPGWTPIYFEKPDGRFMIALYEPK